MSEVRPDGLLIVRDPKKLAGVEPPWDQAQGHAEVLVEIKMQGDHAGPPAMQRALLRRQVRQVQRIEAVKHPAPPWLGEEPLWMVSASLHEVVRQLRQVSRFAPGCYHIGPSAFAFAWIAANELPLREDLIPFLMARSGGALDEFLRWVARRRPLDWVLRVLQSLPVSTLVHQQIIQSLRSPPPTDDPVLLEQRRDVTRFLVDLDPALRRGYVEEGVTEGVTDGELRVVAHQFDRKLGRALRDEERYTLRERLHRLGPDRLGDVVVDLPAEDLAAWLVTPDAI